MEASGGLISSLTLRFVPRRTDHHFAVFPFCNSFGGSLICRRYFVAQLLLDLQLWTDEQPVSSFTTHSFTRGQPRSQLFYQTERNVTLGACIPMTVPNMYANHSLGLCNHEALTLTLFSRSGLIHPHIVIPERDDEYTSLSSRVSATLRAWTRQRLISTRDQHLAPC
ncbi:hypothetical protein FA15DRAFT_664209 [Coprinopsis marcescibilis]|uniref:Uncharacterized protein n=1 Tax=Coprinopsis marcescibilis TaxID=230819 RepID=A0A5C3L956_COPMA|nr:hypothetical protein FA15DRAFT_664209 [Coprinopsis marcescibilis]